MSIVRVAKRPRFAAIARDTINDERLSFRARGVLAWFLDKPDDWESNSEAVARASAKEGRDAIRTAFKELREHGYMRQERLRIEGGKFVTVTFVYERPYESAGQTGDGIPGDGSPGAGFPGDHPLETDTEETPSRAEYENDFDRAWAHYPRKEARKAALKQYQARRRAGVDPSELHLATQRYARLVTATGRAVMLGQTFYGPNERWKDFLDFDAAMAREVEAGRAPAGRAPAKPPSAKPFVCSVGNPDCVNGMVLGDDGARPCECRQP